MLSEDQLEKLANLFKEEIIPAIKKNEKEFNEMYERARKFLDEFEKLED